MLKGRSVLIIGKVWPEPKSSAAGSRMIQLIKKLYAEELKICFASAASKSEYSADLSSWNVNEREIRINDSSFDIFLQEYKPDIVLFDRFMTEEQFGWRVEEQCPNALRILDTEDLHFLRYARQQAWKEGRPFKEEMLFNEHAIREIASILRCDISLIISAYEMKLLMEVFKIEPGQLLHLPFMLNSITNIDISSWRAIEKRKHFTSIGNFLHEPNWNAVLYLKEEIWPLIRKQIPDAQLHIYGSYSSQKVEQLHNEKEGFLVKGRAADALEVIEGSRVLLAPIRFGAGLKGKLLDAMKSGTPSVTTSIGAEGMHGSFDWPGIIADDAESIAEAAVLLYQDQQEWKAAQDAIIPILVQIYDQKALGDKLMNRLNFLMNHLSEHRRKNFIGKILRHHTLSSTKYMSKWIEAKNS